MNEQPTKLSMLAKLAFEILGFLPILCNIQDHTKGRSLLSGSPHLSSEDYTEKIPVCFPGQQANMMLSRFSNSPPLHQFIPYPDLQISHRATVHAPASLVMETARTFDLTRTPMVRAIFWLRGMILRGKAAAPDWSQGFLKAMLHMGWGLLAESTDSWLMAGTVCQPWLPDVQMTPLSPEKFIAYSAPNYVRIVWTLQAEAIDETHCRFTTETRAAATDEQARVKFLRYHRLFGIGMAMTRWLLLPAVRREAERRWRASTASEQHPY
jgi:hypothetical protein